MDSADRGEKIRTKVSQTKKGGAWFLNRKRKGKREKKKRKNYKEIELTSRQTG